MLLHIQVAEKMKGEERRRTQADTGFIEAFVLRFCRWLAYSRAFDGSAGQRESLCDTNYAIYGGGSGQ